MLAAWDGSMAADRAEPLIVTAWWRELAFMLYADELGADFRQNWSPRAPFVQGVLKRHSAWCDDVRTSRVETCDEILSESLDRALRDLRRRFGDDVRSPGNGGAHAAQHRHRPFSRSSVLARFFDIAVPSPGDAYSLNVGRSDFSDEAAPCANRHAAGYRAIYDLADPAGVALHPVGRAIRESALAALPQLSPSLGRAASTSAMVTDRKHARGERRTAARADAALAQAAFFSSRRARRRILPTLVFGRSVRNSTYLGRL